MIESYPKGRGTHLEITIRVTFKQKIPSGGQTRTLAMLFDQTNFFNFVKEKKIVSTHL